MSTEKQPLTTPLTTDWEFDTGVQYLVRHRGTGTYYGRARVGKKVVRKSLGTKVLSEAKEKLPHFLIAARQEEPTTPSGVKAFVDPRWADAEGLYYTRLGQDSTAAAASVRYRYHCLRSIRESWPTLGAARLADISPDNVRAWAARVAKALSPNYYNNILATAAQVWVVLHEIAGRPAAENPFGAPKRLGVKPSELTLPEPEQWSSFLGWVDAHPSGAAAAKLLRLMAFFGLRVSEATSITWGDFDWRAGFLKVQGAKDRAASSTSNVRRVPIIRESRDFFEPLAAGKRSDELVSEVEDLRWWFATAEEKLGLPHLSHHDMRHLFATRCIESGVDIPTVSRWLGHKDGGVLAMRVYGHLREEHSQAAAQKVSFS